MVIKYLYTICGTKIKVDEDIYEKYGEYSWRIPREGTVSSSQEIEGKKERNLRTLVLRLNDEDVHRTVYYKDGDRYNLTKNNLSMTNVEIYDKGDYMEAKLPNGESFIFDRDDLSLVKSRTWYISKVGYVMSTLRGKHRYFHREIKGSPEGLLIDHVNHNKLDNRKVNLEIVTHSDNVFNRKGAQINNTSGQRGVHKTGRGKWAVRFTKQGVTEYVGTFSCIEEAKKVSREYLDNVGIYAQKRQA